MKIGSFNEDFEFYNAHEALLKSISIPDYGEQLRKSMEQIISPVLMSNDFSKIIDSAIPKLPDFKSLAVFNQPVISADQFIPINVRKLSIFDPIITAAGQFKTIAVKMPSIDVAQITAVGSIVDFHNHFKDMIKIPSLPSFDYTQVMKAAMPSIGSDLSNYIKAAAMPSAAISVAMEAGFRTYSIHEYLDTLINSDIDLDDFTETEANYLRNLISNADALFMEFSANAIAKSDEFSQHLADWFYEAYAACNSKAVRGVLAFMFIAFTQMYSSVLTNAGKFIANPNKQSLEAIFTLSESNTKYVSKYEVKLHYRPSDSSKVICIIPSGYQIKVLEKNKVWMNVQFNDEKNEVSFTGWVRIDFFGEL